jgi:hypothetical protein
MPWGFKMTGYSEILVLIANEKNATICANLDGVTRQLRTIEYFSPVIDDHNDSKAALSNRYVFACELMMALGRSVRENVCEGVVIFAEAKMMEELRRVQTGTVTRLLLAQIVGLPSEYCGFADFSAANTELAYCEALQ